MNKIWKFFILFIVINKILLFLRRKSVMVWNWFQGPITTQK